MSASASTAFAHTLCLDHAEVLLQQRNISSAIALFDEAQRLGADRGRCAAGRWFTHMLRGEFEAAWQESDTIRHWGRPDPHRFWNGEDLRGKRVILRCLHGFGDAVQMLRYAPILRSICADLIIEVPPRLLSLAPCFTGVDDPITWAINQPAHFPGWDVQVEIMELPYLFRTQITELPIATNYLTLSAESKSIAAIAMGPRKVPRVGIVWTAGEWNPSRSVSFRIVERIFDQTGCEFWNLQGDSDQSAWNSSPLATQPRAIKLRDAAECGEGILALAAVIQDLDLVVTVDTLAAHLAGALGTPAWILLQHAADWRWMIGRSDSPWYPSLCLFRQPVPGDWNSVIEAVSGNLELWLRQENQADLLA